MHVGEIVKGAQLLVKHNSPAILTGVAVVGTVTTALLAAKGGFKAAQVISHEETRLGHPITGLVRLSNKERAKIAWPLFMPAVGVGALTIACVLGANHIQGRRAAALAGAYSLTEKAFSEYKAKVVEQVGAGKEQKVRDAVAQDQIDRNPPKTSEIIITEATDIVCYEAMSGRYFTTTAEKIKQSVNEINKKIIDEMYASLGDFWDLLGLENTSMGDQLGWTTDRMLDVDITTTMGPDQKPCLHLGYKSPPDAGYYKSFR